MIATNNPILLIYVRHASAAADTWSSSKPSNVGASRAHRRTLPQRPGRPRHDPAWLSLTALRKPSASGDDVARAGDPANRSSDHLNPRSWTAAELHAAPEGHVPSRRCASRQPVRPPHNAAKTEIPISRTRGPRLPALKDSVRLPASDILHNLRHSRLIEQPLEADGRLFSTPRHLERHQSYPPNHWARRVWS